MKDNLFETPRRGATFFGMALDPTSRAFRTFTLLRNLGPYMAYYRKLHTSGYGQIVPKGEGFYNRKFVTPYLATFLTSAERLIIQGNLCDFLDRVIRPQSLVYDLNEGIVLWQADVDGTTQSVVLKIAARTVLEGDLLLEHRLGHQTLHKISFAFVPGRLMGVADAQIAFIGGSQGLPGSADSARTSARHNGEITPANMTLIAMRGLCQALGIDKIYGVRARYQPVIFENPDRHNSVYDDLWAKNLGEAQARYFIMKSDVSNALAKDVEGKNRSRTRRKRRYRMTLIRQIAEQFNAHVNPGAVVRLANSNLGGCSEFDLRGAG